ncbi:hypothetical protein [Phenylobacterium sp.]|uniref:hypothetical protein n=1 Tax=Phenylobacterium sp. TaxID=1871053 RepID=UPI002F93E8AD
MLLNNLRISRKIPAVAAAGVNCAPPGQDPAATTAAKPAARLAGAATPPPAMKTASADAAPLCWTGPAIGADADNWKEF